MATLLDTGTIAERRLVMPDGDVGYADNTILGSTSIAQRGSSIASLTLNGGGLGYTSVPTIGFTSTSGSGAAATAQVKTTGITLVTPQSGGGSYVPGDVLTLAGTGGNTTITVNTTQVISATITSGGSGGTNGTTVVNGTSGSGIAKFQANITIAGGAITAINSIVSGGTYTANPTNINAEPVSFAGLTGATLALKMGVLDSSITTAPNLTGITANPISATGGSGSGATFNATYSVAAINLTNGGDDYDTPPTVTFSSSGSTTAATATATLSTTSASASFTFSEDLSTLKYGVFPILNEAHFVSVQNKTKSGFDMTFTPKTGGSIGAGNVDFIVNYTN